MFISTLLMNNSHNHYSFSIFILVTTGLFKHHRLMDLLAQCCTTIRSSIKLGTLMVILPSDRLVVPLVDSIATSTLSDESLIIVDNHSSTPHSP